MNITLQTIGLLISILFLKAEQSYDKIREFKVQIGDNFKPYARVLIALVWSTLLIPTIFLLIILLGDTSLIDVIGAASALLIAALFLFASPVDALARGLYQGGTLISADYFRNVLTVELCVILSTWIIPFQYKPPSILLPVIVGAIFFGLINALMFSRKTIAVSLAITCLFLVRCYIFPESCPYIGYCIMIIKDTLSEQYPALIAAMIGGLLIFLIFDKKAVGITVTIMAIFFVCCYMFPQHVPLVGDEVKAHEKNLMEKIDGKGSSNKFLTIITTPAGANIYIGGQYKGKTPNVKISDQDLVKAVTLKMPGYKQINVNSSDIRDDKIVIRLERDAT